MTTRFVPYDAVIVGAGISGLVCAHAVRRAGLRPFVLEAGDRVGGCISTVRRDGCIADGGPQTFAAAPSFMQLVSSLGLDRRLQRAADGTPWFYAHGRLAPAPSSPGALLASPLLSPLAKLRVLAEPLIGARATTADESVAAFAARRGGRAVVDALVRPMIAGIYAGDPLQTSAQSAIPGLVELERRYTSVIVGTMARMFARRTGPRPRRVPLDFAGGNDLLTEALAAGQEPDIALNARATEIVLRGANIEVVYASGGGGDDRSVVARHAVLATPAHETGRLLAVLEPEAAEVLANIAYAPMAQVALSYDRAAIGRPTRGFGFLNGERTGLRILGCAFNSTMFADRCPPDRALVTAFLGGMNDPDVAAMRDDELVGIVHRDLQRVLDVRATPSVVAGFRWDRAIPQYAVGHADRIRTISFGLVRLPQVSVIGNYLRGPSVSDCIAVATAKADAIVARISTQ